MKHLQSILFFAYFYAAWFGSLWLGKNGFGIFALLLFLPSLFYSMVLHMFSKGVWIRAFLLGCLGIGFDQVMSVLGLVQFFGPEFSVLIPLWLIGLWLTYVAYLPTMAQLFAKQRKIAVLLGAIFGPLSYFSGAKMGMMTFSQNEVFLVYAAFWGLHLFLTLHFLQNSSTHDPTKMPTPTPIPTRGLNEN